MTKHNKKKVDQLGMSVGKAQHILKKSILWDFVKKAKLDVCYQCGEKIESIEELTVEHKIPWLDSEKPVELYFDLDNISYSHMSCNYAAARKPGKIYKNLTEKRKADWAKYWNKMTDEEKRTRRKTNYAKYGC